MADPTPAPITMPEGPSTATPPTAPAPSAAVGAALLYPADTPAPEGGTGTPTTPAEDGPQEPPAPVETPPEGEAPKEEVTPTPPKDASPSADVVPPVEGAPLTAASYEVKLPEGMEINADLLTTAKDTFAKIGVDPKGAQPLIDLYVQALEAQNAANLEAWNAQDAKWRQELFSLPEFKGATRRTSEATIGRLLDEYGGDELRSVLVDSGLTNNPTLLKTLLAIGNVLTEGAPAPQGAPANPGPNGGRPPRGQTPGQILYGDSSPSNQ